MSAGSITAPTLRRHLTADEFQRMVETGILTEDERIELLGGEMYWMAAIGVRHANAVRRLINLLAKQTDDTVIVDAQNPIRLDDESVPQPDVSIVRNRHYLDGHPRPSDVLLVIEVADSSRDYDRGTKFPRYAAAGIAEAWLVDLIANLIERHSDPRDGIYRQIAIARPGDILSSTMLSGVAVPVADILGAPDATAVF